MQGQIWDKTNHALQKGWEEKLGSIKWARVILALQQRHVSSWDILLEYGGTHLEYFFQNLEKMIITTLITTLDPVPLM